MHEEGFLADAMRVISSHHASCQNAFRTRIALLEVPLYPALERSALHLSSCDVDLADRGLQSRETLKQGRGMAKHVRRGEARQSKARQCI